MYGMVNKALQGMITHHYGPLAWNEVRARAGVDVETFISNEGYPDEITYRLAVAASEALNIPLPEILESFGRYWLLVTAREGYGALLSSAGRDIREFLLNLPNFHNRVSLILPQLQPPQFLCSDVAAGSLRLHYISHRPGLTPFVLGLLNAIGELFHQPVSVHLAKSRAGGDDHDEFEVAWEAPV
jgi:Haem-NO-binding